MLLLQGNHQNNLFFVINNVLNAFLIKHFGKKIKIERTLIFNDGINARGAWIFKRKGSSLLSFYIKLYFDPISQ